MPRALFEKVGSAVYFSHLDLMRLFQRAYKRAGLPLTHTQGFNPRPSVSIALPLSLGVESQCELLDFELEGERISNTEIRSRLNQALVEGVRILQIYDDGRKLKELALLESEIIMEYDNGIPTGAGERICALFSRDEVIVEKKGKNGMTEQNLIPMLRRIHAKPSGERELSIRVLACCQNPTLNPMLISAAVSKYLPEDSPDFVRCRRLEIYDANETIFR